MHPGECRELNKNEVHRLIKISEKNEKNGYESECSKNFDRLGKNLKYVLDRLDNAQGHNHDNTVISCLKCNLERRTRNDKKFLFSKQMRVIKNNYVSRMSIRLKLAFFSGGSFA